MKIPEPTFPRVLLLIIGFTIIVTSVKTCQEFRLHLSQPVKESVQ